MNDEAKQIVKDLRLHGFDNPSCLGTHMGICDIAADMIEKLSADRNAWKRRAEAAERDITSMLESCDCEIRHEYCARCYTPNECNTDKCAGYAKWRGPCEENGGVDNEAD